MLLAVVTIVITSCGNKKNQSENTTFSRPKYAGEIMGTITNVEVFVTTPPAVQFDGSMSEKTVAEVPQGVKLVSDSVFVKTKDGKLLSLDIPLNLQAHVSIDLDEDGIPDRIVTYPFVGQEVGNKISLHCGNFLKTKI